MALSEDQKAMLRLLAQRGQQGYDDLAALKGLSVEQVWPQVREALDQLEAEGLPAPAIEPPAGVEAEPAPASAAEPEQPPAEPAPAEQPDPKPAAEKAAKPRRAKASKSQESPAAPPAGRPKLGLPRNRSVQAAIGAGLLALIAVVVLLVAGSDSGSEGSATASGGAGSGAATTAANEESNLTEAVLSPVDGGQGEGRALFGRIKKNVILQVEATGLDPSPQGSSYTIWLYKSPQLALRIGAVKVNKSGGIAVQLPIPTELLAYVASGAFDQIDIALTENAAYAAEVAKAKKEKRLPKQVGESVLRGKISGPAVR